MNKKRSLLFDSTLVYFICLFCFVLMRIITQVLVTYYHIEISDTLDFVLNLISQLGLMFIIPTLLLSLFQKQKIKTTLYNFGYDKLGYKPIIIAILLGVLCYFLNHSVAGFFSTIIEMTGFETLPSISSTTKGSTYTTQMFLINVVSACILPAICEETLHRGLLLKGSYSLGVTRALVLSSVMFGLMHLNINQFFYATILGFIIGIVAIAGKNIIPAMIIHFMNNFLSAYFSYARANNLFGSKIYNGYINFLLSGDNMIIFFLKNFIVLSVLLFSIVLLISLLLKETRIKKVNKMLGEIADINKQLNPNNPYLQNNSNLMNLQFLNNLMKQYNIKDINTMVLPETEIKRTKPNAFQITMIVACIVLGVITTVFTFVWGIL